MVDFLDKQFVLPRNLLAQVEHDEPPFGKTEPVEVPHDLIEYGSRGTGQLDFVHIKRRRLTEWFEKAATVIVPCSSVVWFARCISSPAERTTRSSRDQI